MVNLGANKCRSYGHDVFPTPTVLLIEIGDPMNRDINLAQEARERLCFIEVSLRDLISNDEIRARTNEESQNLEESPDSSDSGWGISMY